jgi:hypothetical protein
MELFHAGAKIQFLPEKYATFSLVLTFSKS